MVISFSPKFNIGDIVYPKVNNEYNLMVMGYDILRVDENGTIVIYNINCSDDMGLLRTYRPYELELLSEVEKES